MPTSIFVCDTGGMVVICAGTTGYNATLDLRYHWMRQKRLQGSHFANDEQADGINKLVIAGKVDPCLSRVFPFARDPASAPADAREPPSPRQHGDPRRRPTGGIEGHRCRELSRAGQALPARRITSAASPKR